jgi:ABC-type multidrug transport system permease subunit
MFGAAGANDTEKEAELAEEPAVEVRDLRKSYAEVTAVDGVDLEVARGEVFGILGPNGAGKTTTLEIIEGLREPDWGEVRVAGYDALRATPLPLPSFIGARVVTQLVVALAQVAILLGMAKLLFDLRVVGSLLSVATFVVLGSLAFLSLGFFLAGISGKVESANALANLVAFPMLFLSGVFFRLDVAPQWVQYVAHALPLTYLAEGLRQVMVYGTPLAELWPEILALLVTTGVGLALVARSFRWDG